MAAKTGRFAGLFKPMYPSNPKPMSAIRRRKLLFSYAPDWIITILLAACFYALDKVTGYRREFSLTDTSLRYPYAEHERVPNPPLYFIVFGIPIILQPIINFITVRSWWDFHNSSLGLVLGLALTGAVTQFIKITVGRPRPDIIARCIPPPGATDSEFGLFNWKSCTQTEDAMLNEGFRSFPSGHSSMSFAGLGFLAFYLAGKLHLFDTRGHAGKAWVSLFPFCGAAMVAISRSMDYRHHWHDIVVGSALGIVMSYFAYRQYYPPLSSELSHRPYSPRIKDNDSQLLPVHSHASAGNSTSYNPNTVNPFPSSNNRYNTTPSPPLVNPFNPPHGYEDNRLGVDGTVQRPGPGSITDVWKQGDSAAYEGTVPRDLDDGNTSSSHGLTTREQQALFHQQQNQRAMAMTASPSPSLSPQNQQEEYSIPMRKTSHPTHQPAQQPQDPKSRRDSDAYGANDAYGGMR